MKLVVKSLEWKITTVFDKLCKTLDMLNSAKSVYLTLYKQKSGTIFIENLTLCKFSLQKFFDTDDRNRDI